MKNSINIIDCPFTVRLSIDFPAGILFVLTAPLSKEESNLALSAGKRKEHRPGMGQMFIKKKAG